VEIQSKSKNIRRIFFKYICDEKGSLKLARDIMDSIFKNDNNIEKDLVVSINNG
jgi:hypothetical protein